MPEISRFFGIVIKMYIDDHPPPHFHVEYSEHRAIVGIRTLVVIDGYLPSRVLGLVVEWASQHQDELLDLWERASAYQPLYRVAPLE